MRLHEAWGVASIASPVWCCEPVTFLNLRLCNKWSWDPDLHGVDSDKVTKAAPCSFEGSLWSCWRFPARGRAAWLCCLSHFLADPNCSMCLAWLDGRRPWPSWSRSTEGSSPGSIPGPGAQPRDSPSATWLDLPPPHARGCESCFPLQDEEVYQRVTVERLKWHPEAL